jgi:Cd2+/Zn2+-exporting ATPase
VADFKEIAGHGLYGIIEQNEVVFGNIRLLEKYNVEIVEELTDEKIYLAVNKKIVGSITLNEEILEENIEALKQIKKNGITRIIMLTGDNESQAQKIADRYSMNEVYSSLLPTQKQEKIKELKEKNTKVLFIGDGINDAPVLAESDFGISMGAGTEIANTTSDAILMNNRISVIPDSIKVSKKTMGIVKFNIIFSLFIKMVVLILGTLGYAPIWSAVLADTGVTLITVLNAIRILKK